MSNGEVIKCKPTKWFFVRAIAMVAMFAVFLVLFLKDWKVGWPKKNEIYYTFQAFKKAGEAFAAYLPDVDLNPDRAEDPQDESATP